MTIGNVKKFTKNKGYESLNRNMLQDVKRLSLDAIGLLSNLTSYPDDWTIHKTELYKRYSKSGRRKVERAWNELVEEHYIVQLRRRKGKTYEYIYYHNQERFTEDEIKAIEETEGCSIWDGKVSNPKKEEMPSKNSSTVQNEQSKSEESSTVQNEQSKLDSTNRTDKKLTINQVYHQQSTLDTLDTKDTQKPAAKSKRSASSLSDQERKKRKEQYMDDAFYANQERVPKRISDMLHVFFDSTEESVKYYNLILVAKKNAEADTGVRLWFENEPEIEHEVINAFGRTYRKIEKERNVDNPEGYIYKSIYDVIVGVVGNRLRPSHYTPDKRFAEAFEE